MCLLSTSTRELAVESGTLEILLGKLEADVVDGTLAGACLDALLALLADSNVNQIKFLDLGGINKVCARQLHADSYSTSGSFTMITLDWHFGTPEHPCMHVYVVI